MDDQTKAKIAVGRWEIWLQHRFVSEGARHLAENVAAGVMKRHFGLSYKDEAFSLTGDQMLFRTNLKIALLENKEFQNIIKG